MNDLSAVLVSLSRLDAAIAELEAKEKAIVSERQRFDADCRKLEQSLAQIGSQHAAAVERQLAEETRLRDEQRKIVERRKQLTALGGSKSAKLLEREVDVAGRAIVQLESRVVAMLEEAEKLDKKRLEIQSSLEVKQEEKPALVSTWESMLSGIKEEISAKRALRDEALVTLTPQLKQTYSRIGTRYPGSAVTKAESGSCKACYRALPAQVFNTVLGGKELVQCPGCSRILVSSELFEVAA